ncbi:helix-turn-helix transcriptional regulator [Paenibacillus flagellatus]|nr:helix-turn-helix domain-containing protein [Paenibacillus flagellatus]
MGKWHQLRQNTNSLFIKLLTSFMAIIVLLISFNFLSYTFFRNNVTEEILRYNKLNLDKTVSDYEKHLTLVRNLAFTLYFSPDVELLKISSPRIHYDVAGQIRQNIRNTINNENLYLNNLILYFRETGFIIEREGTSPAETMFTKYYRSDSYPYDFWKNEFARDYSYKLFPAASFVEQAWETPNPKGTLIPFIIKDSANAKLMIVAMLDAGKMFGAFHQSINRNLIVLDRDGRTIFSSVLSPELGITLDKLPEREGYLKIGTDYYFYSKHAASGFTYVNIVPNAGVSQQIVKLNVILVTLLVLAIVISVGTSVLFSIRMNNPLKRIVQSVQQLNAGPHAPRARSPIKEFDIIGDRLSDLMQTNRVIHEDLQHKNSLLQYYTYMNKLKMIRTNGLDWKESAEPEKPFVLTVFDITFRRSYYDQMETDSDFAAYFLKEYIATVMGDKYADATVFQMEKNQILALVFPKDGEPPLAETLAEMKRTFDRDRHYCFLTIASSPVYPDSSRFTEAYEKALALLKHRPLGDDTIIVTEPGEARDGFHTFTLLEEQEFHANLQAGNAPAVVQQTMRALAALHRKRASAREFAEFSRDLLNKTVRVLAALQLDGRLHAEGDTPGERLADCHTLERYEAFWTGFLSEAAGWIKRKKEAHDPITSFVFHYLEHHYGEDISLELLADKLNITGAYLSTYFKEKTGMNFSDYLNGMRMNIAKEMLQHSTLKIQDVAAKVGYHNVNSFIRMFKRYAGLPPGEFRKTAQQEP